MTPAMILMIPALLLCGASLLALTVAARESGHPGLRSFARLLLALILLSVCMLPSPADPLAAMAVRLADYLCSSFLLFFLTGFARSLGGRRRNGTELALDGGLSLLVLGAFLAMDMGNAPLPWRTLLQAGVFAGMGAMLFRLGRRDLQEGSMLTRDLVVWLRRITLGFLPLLALDSLGSLLAWPWWTPMDGTALPAFLGALGLLVLWRVRDWSRSLPWPGGLDDGGEVPRPPDPACGDAPALTVRPEELLAGRLGLPARQADIAWRIYCGDGAKAIADALDISPKTVENTTAILYRRLDVHSRLQFYHRVREALAPADAAGDGLPPGPAVPVRSRCGTDA